MKEGGRQEEGCVDMLMEDTVQCDDSTGLGKHVTVSRSQWLSEFHILQGAFSPILISFPI